MAEDAKLPRSKKNINGIVAGPDVRRPEVPGCGPGQAKNVPDANIATTDWGAAGIATGYLPTGAAKQAETAVSCRGDIIWHSVSWHMPLDQADAAQVRAGTMSWFDARHGGFIEVHRARLAEPAWTSPIPDARMRAATIAGKAAIVAAPVMKSGFGEGTVVTWDGEYLTQVIGMNLTTTELVKIAEGVQQ